MKCLESRAGSDGRCNTCLQSTCRSLEGERKSVSETLDPNRSLTGPTKRDADLGHVEPSNHGTDHKADAAKLRRLEKWVRKEKQAYDPESAAQQ